MNLCLISINRKQGVLLQQRVEKQTGSLCLLPGNFREFCHFLVFTMSSLSAVIFSSASQLSPHSSSALNILFIHFHHRFGHFTGDILINLN